MKQRTEKISARLRNYGKNSTKKSNDCQVELEIRNFTDKPLRINAKNKDNSLMQLKPHQMKKGVCISRSDANIINARLNKLKERLKFVMEFLVYNKSRFKQPINKPLVEDFLFRKYSEVEYYFTEMTDVEDIDNFFNNLFRTKEETQREIEYKKKFLVSIGDYQPTGFMDGLKTLNIEHCRKETILPNFEKWCKSLNREDYPIEKFDKKAFDGFTRFMIQQPKRITKDNVAEYYAVKTIDNMTKEVKIYLKALKELKYQIDDEALKFKLKKGNRRDSHISFVDNEKANVFSINYVELEKIRFAVYDDSLPDNLRNAATLFVIQTLLGGLRISELNLITKESFIEVNGRYNCYFTTKKTGKMIDSPLHSELLPILQKIDFNIDKLKFRDNNEYNSELKKLAIKLDFNRDIVQYVSNANADTQEVKIFKLFNLFTNRLARKAAITLLFNTGKYSLEQIAMMTEHSLDAIQYYVAILHDDKAKMMGSL